MCYGGDVGKIESVSLVRVCGMVAMWERLVYGIIGAWTHRTMVTVGRTALAQELQSTETDGESGCSRHRLQEERRGGAEGEWFKERYYCAYINCLTSHLLLALKDLSRPVPIILETEEANHLCLRLVSASARSLGGEINRGRLFNHDKRQDD